MAAQRDDSALDFELDLTGQRRLAPELLDLDVRLQRWAFWARPHYAARGFPIGPVGTRGADRDDWPAQVGRTDDEVGRLHPRFAAAVMAAYLPVRQASAERAATYVALAQHLAQLRGVAPPAPSAGAFRDDLDRARWVLRSALGIGL